MPQNPILTRSQTRQQKQARRQARLDAIRTVRSLYETICMVWARHPNLRIVQRSTEHFFLRVPGYAIGLRITRGVWLHLAMNDQVLVRHLDHAEEIRETLLSFLEAELGD